MSSSQTHALPSTSAEADAFLSEPSPGLLESLSQLEGPVTVLGAGGKMGLHICRMLKRSGELLGKEIEVTAVSRFRTLRGREVFEQAGIKTAPCELEDEVALAGLENSPNIIFMAGAKFGTSDQPDLLKRMNADLPIKASKRFPGAKIIVFSTGCVYAMVTPESGGSRESDPTEPPGIYAQSCLDREKAFTAAACDFGSRVCLVRLNYSTEFRYGVLVDICQKVLLGEPVSLDMGWVNVIWQRDAVDHILRTFTVADTSAKPLNITGSGIHSVRDIALGFGKLLNKPVTFSGSEGNVAWLNNASTSHKLFGEPPTSLETMMEWTASWALQGGEIYNKPTGFEKRDGKF
ncbi:NAD-dependent epimerase/dehydratase family protein [Ruficoccus amylovorans]|nr:NAD(P)-dependent oxidoreductase [Ruficoccus amylovorans]